VTKPAHGNLDLAMRQVLAELELTSHGSTQSWNSSGHGGGESVNVFPPGESRPPHIEWRERYERAVTDDARQRIIEDAGRALRGIIRRAKVTPTSGESEKQFAARVISTGRGFGVGEVATAMRCTPTRVRRIRLANGVSLEFGLALTVEAPDGDVERRARTLAEQGMSVRQIEMLTGMSKSWLHRMLGRAA